MAERILVYGHPACPAVGPVRVMLQQVKADFDYINIRREPQAAAFVRSVNSGNESVPTLLFPDGSTLTEPSASQLKNKLEAMGYCVPWWAWLVGNSWQLIIGAIILFAILRFLEIM